MDDKGQRSGSDSKLIQCLAMIGPSVQMAILLPREMVTGALSEVDQAHTLMPILDPTLYRAGMYNMRHNADVIRAWSAFQKEILAIKERAEQDVGAGRATYRDL